MGDDPHHQDRLAHARVGSYFLGPKAENFHILSELMDKVLEDQRIVRKNLYPDDPAFITSSMMQATTYTESINELRGHVKELSENLALHSIPFWSPRYNAHMNMDVALPSIIGYMATMMYNPNNVATEASPFTTKKEREVGEELCTMLGYRKTDDIEPWGHITCDGSVANLEAIWAIRNLKFYPLSLKLAISNNESKGIDPPLKFLAHADPPFVVENCKGDKKRFVELDTWELLNLKPSTILELPTRLTEEYSITAQFLQDALKPYLIQTVGKDNLERRFGIENSGKVFLSTTKHYSWPKGGAISGIGSDNFINVAVDEDARMDIQDLRKHLDSCIESRTPVYGGVAIMGSTEHGACDPLAGLVDLRQEYEAKGLSFAIHADAAWGGYFASLIDRSLKDLPGDELPLVPALTLQPYTRDQLEYLQFADSITIDPHKSGYINYPAGGLCYRDGRMRYLITWTSPIVYHEGDEEGSMGVFGVEGSKPGAAAVATWLTHRMLKLDPEGYGRLLGEAIFTCTKLYCHWATMTRADDDLIVCPLIRLPSEKKGDASEGDIEKEKQRIREKILSVTNEQLLDDLESLELLSTLGGDLMINAFACNFKVNGKVNDDVNEANYLNQRIFQRLSVTSMKDVVATRPLFLTASSFGESTYGKCLETYKRRLQLVHEGSPARGDLAYLVNVTMSPYPTDRDFLSTLVEDFRRVANEEVKKSIIRNKIEPDFHGFVMQGLDQIHLVHIPMFNMANHRWQLIITADFPEDVKQRYQQLRKENPNKFYTVANFDKDLLEDMIAPGAEIKWRLDEGIPKDTPPIMTFKLTNVRVVVQESMFFNSLDQTYPDRMPFYLYGSNAEAHLDHVLKKAPNGMISADNVKLTLEPELSDAQLAKGVVAVFEDVFETAIQPLPLDKSSIVLAASGLRMEPGEKHKTSVYESYAAFKGGSAPIAKGDITLGKYVFADWNDVNMDPAAEECH
ncbi:pyridoxal phosphate-dependent transferase [Trichoderma chlorosporum]